MGGALAAPALAQDQEFQANAHAESIIGGIIDGLIGKKYNVSDRKAIHTCGWAAVRQAERDYRRYFTGPPHSYPGYRGYVRVAAITDVKRLSKAVRVRGLLDTARYGYRGGRNGADLLFRCDVNRNARVTDLRLERNPWYRPR